MTDTPLPPEPVALPSNSLLRNRRAQSHGKVDFVELFFDLIFVFAITQLSHIIVNQPDLTGLGTAGFLLLAVWGVWMWTTWGANWLNTQHATTRLMLLWASLAGLVMAAALPQAFGDQGLAFAVAFTLLQNGRNAFVIYALRGNAIERTNFIRIGLWLGLAGIAWLAGGLAEGTTRWMWWGLALFLELGSPWWRFWVPQMGASAFEDWSVHPAHIAERCGLFIIIALGETIVMVGSAFAGGGFDLPSWAALGVCAMLVGGLWWIYFSTTAEEAAHAFAHHARPGELARNAYTYAHIPMVAGIVLQAVALEWLVAHPLYTPTLFQLVLTGLGPALFLVGHAWFSRLVCPEWPKAQVIGVLAVVGVCVAASPVVGQAITLLGLNAALGLVVLLVARRA